MGEHRADPSTPVVTRRGAIKGAAALAMAMGTLELTGRLAHLPDRADASPAGAGGIRQASQLPDIQFDIGRFIAAAQNLDGVMMQLPPVNTVFLTGKLLRQPTAADQVELARALDTLEANYPFAAGGLITFVSYGIPYFQRLPGGLNGSLVAATLPRLNSDAGRYVLEEAVPGPTDVSPANPGISKRTFNVPVRIEGNDLLFTLRSDNVAYLADAISWLGGSGMLVGRPTRSPRFGGLLRVTSSRAMFTQMGLPRFVAERLGLRFAHFIHPQSPMWMGFADQHVTGAGPAPICTFAGNPSARLTTARAGDYFDNGGIQHLSHVILDMDQFFDLDAAGNPGADGVFTERVQYMFRSPAINPGNPDQFSNGGGPTFLPNDFRGTGEAARTAQGLGTDGNEHRMGHLSTLQRSSRAADGTALHIRMDGPGFDGMDMPGGANQPKLQFTIFVPTADFFATMRRNQASVDLAQQFSVPDKDNGLERFITATRRQNFLVPPRRHRAFPLVEFT